MRAGLATATMVGVIALVGGAHRQDKTATHDDVVKQMLGVLDKLSKSLTAINSQASADAARPELKKLAKEWMQTRQAAEKLPPPSREDKDRLEKEYKGKLEAAQKKLYGEVVRVRMVPGGPEALQEIRGVLARKKE
jgi:hypothetical protein